MRWRFWQRIEHPVGWTRPCEKLRDILPHLVMRCCTTHPTAGARPVSLAGLDGAPCRGAARRRMKADDSPEAGKKLNRDDPDVSRLKNPQPKTRAERAFHLGGAGTWDRCPPAQASCWKGPILNFFTAPLGKGRPQGCVLRNEDPCHIKRGVLVWKESFMPRCSATFHENSVPPWTRGL
jgi:hypothetical protein